MIWIKLIFHLSSSSIVCHVVFDISMLSLNIATAMFHCLDSVLSCSDGFVKSSLFFQSNELQTFFPDDLLLRRDICRLIPLYISLFLWCMYITLGNLNFLVIAYGSLDMVISSRKAQNLLSHMHETAWNISLLYILCKSLNFFFSSHYLILIMLEACMWHSGLSKFWSAWHFFVVIKFHSRISIG